MTKKKRRHMKLTLTLSVLIAAIPVSLSFVFDKGGELEIPTEFFRMDKSTSETPNTGKVLPMLANK